MINGVALHNRCAPGDSIPLQRVQPANQDCSIEHLQMAANDGNEELWRRKEHLTTGTSIG